MGKEKEENGIETRYKTPKNASFWHRPALYILLGKMNLKGGGGNDQKAHYIPLRSWIDIQWTLQQSGAIRIPDPLAILEQA